MMLGNICYGAAYEDWERLRRLGLTADLLPILCNPNVQISPLSGVTQVGKVPSIFNRDRQLVGLAGWAERASTLADVHAWSREADYGIGIQTRCVRALDVDVTDSAEANAIADFLISRGFHWPRRQRGNSSKFLLCFIVRTGSPLPKRSVSCAHGKIEFLGDGQQFVAVGTHPSGVRYVWPDGLPEDIPEITVDQFDSLWTELVTRFGTSAPIVVRFALREHMADIVMDDPLADYIRDQGADVYRGLDRQRALKIVCPWETGHSSGEPGDGRTVYFRAGTRGYARGHFKCFHDSCTGRRGREFAEALGYSGPFPQRASAEEDFAGLN